MAKEISSGEIAKLIHGECNDNSILVNKFASLTKADETSISFYLDSKYKEQLDSTKAATVILKAKDAGLRDGPCIYVEDPYLAFAKVATLFQETKKVVAIDESLVSGKNLKLGKNATIKAHVSIGDNVTIGDNVFIDSNVMIGDNVRIGANVRIGSNVTIQNDVKIGSNCNFFSGCVIGCDGFGYARDKDGNWLKIPQTGSVTIGDNVDIGANTTIDRGALEDTVIEDGVKIDNQVQIGHNCVIGKNTIMAGCTGVAGSTIIGKNCMIGGGAMFKGHVTVADNTIISAGTGIGKTIQQPGERYTNVFPYNLKHKDWLKIATKLKKWAKDDKTK